MEELEEKVNIAEQARAYFGEDMYKKLMEIDETRNDALMFDQGTNWFVILYICIRLLCLCYSIFKKKYFSYAHFMLKSR